MTMPQTRRLFSHPALLAVPAALVLAFASAAIVPRDVQAQPSLAAALPDFSELVERVGPAVVNIRTTERMRSASGAGGEGDERLREQMREFLRRFGMQVPDSPNPAPAPRRGAPPSDDDNAPRQRGIGSGFIVSADGFVLTNAHVIEGAEEVLVTLTDKREFKARVIGTDRRTDVAVIKIEATGLPTVRIGNVDQLKVGAWVVAIGSPFGLENTVTAGIVSAKGRDTGGFQRFIQTDVAVNPGNSGGPLLNLKGEVVGINSRLLGTDSENPTYIGISLAIPIDDAMRVADQLRTAGRVIRGRIGVRIAPVNKDVAEAIGLGAPRGALVESVEDGLPAQKAGIEPGDIIVKVDGRAVENSTDLPRMVGAAKPGGKTVLQVWRLKQLKDIAVPVVEFEPDRPTRTAQAPAAAPQVQPKNPLGIAVADLTEAQRKEMKLRGGVRVESVDGPAARAGLREGDVIVTLDNIEIKDAKQLGELVAKLDKGKQVSALVRREDSTNFVLIRPPAR
jgi:serine protease Do